MFLFDTDHITIFCRKMGHDYACLSRRMSQHPPTAFFWSIVSMHEQMLGAHNLIAKGKKHWIRGHEILEQIRSDYAKQQILPYDQTADSRHDALQQQNVQIGAFDLRIAAIALSRNLILLTRNRTDFAKVPGLQIDDWTK
jgi:tRNA(fMet)-specific endonuclease VapC